MEWVKANRRWWPAAALALVIVALLWPWGYDRIHVPAEYSCSAPNIRLEGDFCGTPISGARVLLNVARTFAGLPGALLRGEGWWLSGGVREIVLAASPLALVLPLLTMLGRMARDRSRAWWAINVAAWGLAALVAGFIVMIGLVYGGGWALRSPGAWLYFGLAVVVLIVEVASYQWIYKLDRPQSDV